MAISLSAIDDFPATESGGVLTHLARPLRVTDEFPATESGGVLTHLARPLRVTDDFPATESGGVLTHLARPLRVTDDFPATESDGVLTHLVKPLRVTDDFPATESGGVLTHFTQATPKVVPPDLFCLDIDFADTSRPAERNFKAEKIFVELIDPNASIVTELGRLKVPNTLRPELPRGLFATPRLLEIPVVSSYDFFIQDSSTVNIRLDNADDALSQRNYIGWYVQIWGQSLAETTRLIFNGQISEQTTNLTEVRLSMSDLVIQELEQTLPRRKITQETFPTSLAQNTPIPIVFGRAIRHKCPNLAVGYETALAAASSAEATQITVNSAAGMAKGDVISIGLGTDNLETAKISAVNLSSDTVTLTESLENAHAIDEVVVNHSNVYDYLLGEGTCSTIQGRRFKQVFRVYHDGRALPELVSGDLTNDTNLPDGEHTLTLEDHLARPLDDWYANFVIEFYNGDVLEGAIPIESYDSEMNSVTLSAVNALDYNNYRLRGFRFFDGSQNYPWPGYAFMRFAVKYTGEITADVEGFPSQDPTLSSNPAQFIRCLLQDNTWGLGIKNDEIDVESFTAAESSMLDLKMEGAITRETTVAALVEEAAKIRPLKLARDPKGISLHFREPEPTPGSGDYIAKVLPEDLTQQLELPEVVMDPLSELTKELVVNFRPDGDGKFDLSLPPTDADAEEQAAESVRKMGRRVAVDLPFVYDQLTADIVLWREKQTRLAHNRRLRVSVDAAAIILSSDSIKVGERIKVSNNILDSETDWEVARKEETCDAFIQLELVPLPDIYSQDPRDLDRLSGVLKYPYGERDFHLNESSFKPPTDFSQTHPEPIRNLFAQTRSVGSGDESVFVCELSYEVPAENYSGAQVWLVLGNTGTPQRVTDEELVVDRLSTTSRKARFNLPLEIASYTVVVYSVSENKELLGFPVSFLINTAPVASAGIDRSAGAGASVALNGSGSHDPDGDPLTYSWTQLSGTPVTLNGADTARPSFRAPSTSSRHTLVFQLIVSDGNVTDTDTVTVNVAAYVPPPSYAPSPSAELRDVTNLLPPWRRLYWSTSYGVNRAEYRYLQAGSVLTKPPQTFSPSVTSGTEDFHGGYLVWVEVRTRRASDYKWSRWVRSLIPP